ncbi:MAG: helix-turn-helix domain-containing protein [Clostridiales bacterium]|jgi:transcriptional regulator with XRE-family HTH domain|nr:helix-turn-helix domain-containing protein [Clostridiales bacterium]
MEKQPKRFGDYIKELRRSNEITLKDMAEYLDLSLAFLCGIESNGRKPLEAERLELLAKKFGLSDEDKNFLYDLEARESKAIPQDIEDVTMYMEAGGLARLALRKTKSGSIAVEDWKRFIKESESGGKR